MKLTADFPLRESARISTPVRNNGRIQCPDVLPDIRPASAAEYERLLTWLNGIFHPAVPDFFQTHYCHLFRGADALGEESLVIESGEGYLGHIGVYVFDLRTSLGPLRVGGIGGVAVAPEARGRGMARQLLDAAHRKAAAAGCVAILLGGIRSIYTGSGYEVCGRQYHWMWDCGQRPVPTAWNRLTLGEAAEVLVPLWPRAEFGVLWKPEITAQLPRRVGWETWVNARRDAYAVVRTGESGMMVDHFLAAEAEFGVMMDAISGHYPEPVSVRHPEGAAFLHGEMTRAGMDPQRRSLGMLKILDAGALEKQLLAAGEHAEPCLSAIAGREFSRKPEDVARQRLASRKVFGDPFTADGGPPPILWDWEYISHV